MYEPRAIHVAIGALPCLAKNQESQPAPIKVMDSSYQPSKAELEADVSIDASPEEVARALMSTVNVQRASPPAKTSKRNKK